MKWENSLNGKIDFERIKRRQIWAPASSVVRNPRLPVWPEGGAAWSSGACRGARRPWRRSGRGRCPGCPTRPPPSTRSWTTWPTKPRRSWSVSELPPFPPPRANAMVELRLRIKMSATHLSITTTSALHLNHLNNCNAITCIAILYKFLLHYCELQSKPNSKL